MSDKEMRIKIRVDNTEFRKAMTEMASAQKKASSGAAGWASSMSSSMGTVEKSTGGLISKLGGLGKGWISAGGAGMTFTAGLTPMTAVLAGVGKAAQAAGKFAAESVSDYANFEGTLKQVQIIAGGTQSDMDMLGDTAIEIGSKTSKGAQEVATAMVDFAKLGFTAKETSEAMKGIVYAAEASGSGVQETAGIVATALNVWNLKATEAEHVADVLAKTANETAADMQDMGYVLQYTGSAASLAGASLEDVSAMAGIMADNGIRGSKAGTSLRTAFTNLINPTDNAAAAMEELGVQFKDSEGKARPTMDVIYDLQDAVKGMDDIQIQELSTILFGKPGAAGMSFVLKKTKEEVQDLSKALENSTGTAAAQAAKMRETMAGQLDQLGDSVDAIKLKIGKGLTDAFALPAVKGMNNVLDKVQDGLNEFASNYARVDGLLKTSSGMVGSKKSADDLANAIKEMGRDFDTMPEKVDGSIQDMAKWREAYGNSANVALQMAKVVRETNFLPDDWEESWGNASTVMQDALTQMEIATVTKGATFRKGGAGDWSSIMVQTINENLPALQAAQETQLATFGTANQKRLDALATFFASEDSMTTEQKQKLYQRELVAGQQQQDTIQSNQNQILEIYKSMSSQNESQRAQSAEKIRALEEANNAILAQNAQASSDEILGVLQAQASATGTITQEAADKAIINANQQYEETVAAAVKQYSESVAAINSMKVDGVNLTQEQKDAMIEAARQQRDGTITHATEQRDGVVGKVTDMAEASEKVDGTHIQINADADTSSAMGQLAELAANINSVFDAFGKAKSAIEGKVNALGSWVNQSIENAGATIDYFRGKGGTKKARGGLTSGVGYGIGGGATYSPFASAVGVGTQLGQAGIGGGVISNERGREVTMPIQNPTYMRPFAAAVAREMQSMGGGMGQPQVIVDVPLYVNGREFARATQKDITEEQQNAKRITNRARGK